MDKPAKTARMVPRHVAVLVVHDAGADVGPICVRLRSEFIVRESTEPFATLEALAARPYACVVCYLGGRVRARDFATLVDKTSSGQPIVFAAGPAAIPDDFAYLREAGRDWLSHPAQPAEVLALARAVAAASR